MNRAAVARADGACKYDRTSLEGGPSVNTRRALLVGVLAFAAARAEAQCQPAEVAGLTWFANIAQQGFARVVDTGTLGVCDGRVRVDWNEFVHAHAGVLGAPFTAGATVWAQGWWRDPQAPLGGAATHGLSFTLCP